MKVITKLKPDYLRACAMIAPKLSDIRYYLNGVLVELLATETRYVGCDGHKLVVIRDERTGDGVQEPFRLIIPKEAIAAVGKVKSPGIVTGIELHYDPEASGAECRLGNTLFKPIEGKYPTYQTVIPRKVSGEIGQYNAQYMLDFQQAARTAFGAHEVAELWQNGNGAALVLIGREPNFVGVIMPMRSESSGTTPAWVLPPEPATPPMVEAANVEPAMAAAE